MNFKIYPSELDICYKDCSENTICIGVEDLQGNSFEIEVSRSEFEEKIKNLGGKQ